MFELEKSKDMKFNLTLILLFSILAHSVFAQITVTGIVTSSEDDEPVIGATIEIKDAENGEGTITEFDGSFSLEVPKSDAVLIFSYLGLKTLEVNVAGRAELDVVMFPESSLLAEVVVVGYGTQKRSNISGAVSVIKSDEITETPILRTEQALQGKASGVLVSQNSGSPGSSLTVRVRGIGSINGSDPLYIVDGIPVSNLDYLNPNDIETMSILKDAASTAIYGSRGSNGVVLITTKNGEKEQEGRITYEGYFGIQSPWKKKHLLNAREYAIIQKEAYIAAGQTPPLEFANPDVFGEGTDWQDAIFETAPIMSHQLGISGGGSKTTYSVSGSYFLQDGIVGGDKARFERYTGRINGQHDVKNWLTIGTNIGLSHFKRNAIPENNEFSTPLIRALNMDPITPVRKFDGTYAYSLYADTDIANPVNQIEQTHDIWKSNTLLGSLFTDIKFMENLSLKTIYSTETTIATQDLFFPRFDLSYDPILSDAPAQEKRLENSVIFNTYRWTTWQIENILTYQKTFKEKHALTAVLANTLIKRAHHVHGGANSNLPSNDPDAAFINNTIDPIESMSTFEYATERALFSYLGRINYDLDDKYLFAAVLRYDGSSRFGPNNRFGYYPSISTGWIISRENFWSIDAVSFLKLRMSWGINGNDGAGDDYPYTAIVLPGQNYVFGPDENITSGSVATVAGNPDIKWEAIIQPDVGLDIELWDGKLNLTTDFYVKRTSGMLYEAPIPHTAGTAPPVQNVATVRNRGWELSASYREKESDFKYSIGGNIAIVKNEVTSVGQGGEPVFSGYIQSGNSFATITDVGIPIASFYGYVTDGLFQNQGEVEEHAFQSENTAPGDIRFKDLNNDGVINGEDRTVIGNPIPNFTYGANIDMEYKGFDLSIFLQGVQGNDLYNGTVRYDFGYVNRPISVLDRWTGEGTSFSEPRVNLSDPNQNARISDRFIEDGSYLRFKNVQLGYNLPKKWIERVRLQKMRVYLSSQNLFTFTKYSGLDPEIGTVGGALEIGLDRGFYPQSRTFLGGIQISF